MKKRILILMIACVAVLSAVAQGFPLMRNYLGKEYGAHIALDWKPLESFQWEKSENLTLQGLFWLLGRE